MSETSTGERIPETAVQALSHLDHSVAPVSVVIPCFDCELTLERAVDSVMSQTLPPAELILVDDGSSDGTLELADSMSQSYASGPTEVRILSSEVNRGASSARNMGWRDASQPFIAFLDADDTWRPKKLEVQWRWMVEHPDVALSGHVRDQTNDDDPCADTGSSTHAGKRVTPVRQLLSNSVYTSTMMLRRDIEYRFQDGKRYSEDFLLTCQIVLSDERVFHLDQSLACIYKSPYGAGGLTKNLLAMELGELHTYWVLWRERYISLVALPLLAGVSLVKYLVRIIDSWLGIRTR